MKKIVIVLAILAVLTPMLFAQAIEEAQFPDPEKNFTIVVGFSAGGGTDLILESSLNA